MHSQDRTSVNRTTLWKNKEEFLTLFKLFSEHNELPQSHKTLIEKIVSETTSTSKPVPYPGESTILRYVEGNWDKPFEGEQIQRQMSFDASNKTAIIRFFLYGYHDGKVSLKLTLPPSSIQKWRSYFAFRSIPRWNCELNYQSQLR